MTDERRQSTDPTTQAANWPASGAAPMHQLMVTCERPNWMEDAHWSVVDRALRILREEYTVRTGGTRADIAYAVGRIFETELNDEEGAIAAYEAGFSASPSHPGVLKAGRRMFGRIGRWSLVLRLLSEELRLIEQNQALSRDILIEMADIYRWRFGRSDEADVLLSRVSVHGEGWDVIWRRAQIAVELRDPEKLLRSAESLFSVEDVEIRLIWALMLSILRCLLALKADREARNIAGMMPESWRRCQPLMALMLTAGPDVFGPERFANAAKALAWVESDSTFRVGILRAAADAVSDKSMTLTSELIALAIKEAPEDHNQWFALGQSHWSMGRLDEAMAAFRGGLRIVPDDAAAEAVSLRLAWLEGASLDEDAAWKTLIAVRETDRFAKWCGARAMFLSEDWSRLYDQLKPGLGHLESGAPNVSLGHLFVAALVAAARLDKRDEARRLTEIALKRAPYSPLLRCLSSIISGEPSGTSSDGVSGEPEWGVGELFEQYAACVLGQPERHWSRLSEFVSDPIWSQVWVVLGVPAVDGETFLGGLEEELSYQADPWTRASTLRWLTRLQLEAGRVDKALDWIERARLMEVVPEGMNELILKACRGSDTVLDTIDAISDLVRATSDKFLGARLLVESAALMAGEAKARHVDASLAERALSKNPLYLPALWLLIDQVDAAHDRESALIDLRRTVREMAPGVIQGHYLWWLAEETWLESGCPDEAVALLEESSALGSHPESIFLSLERVGTGASLPEMIGHSLEHLAGEPFGEFAASSGLRAGAARCFELAGEDLDALRLYREVIAMNPKDGAALRALIRWLDETGDYDVLGIIAAPLRQAIAEEGSLVGTFADIGWTLFMDGKGSLAEDYLATAVERAPGHFQVHLYQYLSAYHQELEGARAGRSLSLAAVCQSSRNRADLYREGAETALMTGQAERAAEAYLLLVRANDYVDEALTALANLAQDENLWAHRVEGLATALQAETQRDDWEELFVQLVECVRRPQLRNGPSLANLCELLERRERTSVRVWQAFGDLAAEKGKWDGAISGYNRARARTTDETLRLALGLRVARIHEAELAQLDSARDVLNQLLDDHPRDMQVLSRLSELELSVESLGPARVALTRAINAAPDPADRALIRLKLAKLDLHEGRLDTAKARLLVATTELPDSAEVYQLLAEVEKRLGAVKRAEHAENVVAHLTQRPADQSGDSPATTPPRANRLGVLKIEIESSPLDIALLEQLATELSNSPLITSLIAGLDSALEQDRQPTADGLEREYNSLPTWRRLDEELLQLLSNLCQLAPPLFNEPPSPATTLAGGVPSVNMPIFAFYDSEDGMVESTRVASMSADAALFIHRRNRSLRGQGLGLLSRLSNAQLVPLIRVLAQWAGVLDGQTHGQASSMLESPGGAGQAQWSGDAVAVIAEALDLTDALEALGREARVIAACHALKTTSDLVGAMRAYRIAQRLSSEEDAESLRQEQSELVRRVLSLEPSLGITE